MTTIDSITPNAHESIANVNITEIDATTITLESADRMALAIAVCTAITNGCEFVSGTDTTATLRKG